MNDQQAPLIESQPLSKFDSLSREELLERVKLQESALEEMTQIHRKLLLKLEMPEQEKLAIQDQLLIIRHKLFGRSSEKRPSREDIERKAGKKKDRDPRVLLPSLKYPDAPLKESKITFEPGKEPDCKLCSAKLVPMGEQTENSEWVSVTQKTYFVQRQMRQKLRCGKCHGDIQTAPSVPRIKPGSGFSDEIAIDVAIAKYCDHLPIERYVNQAERGGLKGVNPQSLIEQTHFLADFLEPVYLALKRSIEEAFFLQADETHWKMLEGDETPNWQLWGFFGDECAYYEAHDTRAAAVAGEFIKNCKASYLVSDAYCGYAKCTRGSSVKNVYCNAHARRKWIEAEPRFPKESAPMVAWYGELAAIEKEIKGLPPDVRSAQRNQRSRPIFEQMKKYCEALWCLPKSSLGTAHGYFLNHSVELTRFLEDGRLPMDNNLSERGLRGPVVGRKNYYGNHSKRGARTMQILYSIIESAKLCNVEPFRYLSATVKAIHDGKKPLTPAEFGRKARNQIQVGVAS
jgi:transposase